MLTISTKELRMNLAGVLEKLEAGESFLLIHRSKIVAEFKKPSAYRSFVEASDQEVAQSALMDLEDDQLSEQETAYYKSL